MEGVYCKYNHGSTLGLRANSLGFGGLGLSLPRLDTFNPPSYNILYFTIPRTIFYLLKGDYSL